MGYEFYRNIRKVDADQMDILHDDSTRLLRLDKSHADYNFIKGGMGTGKGVIFYPNIVDTDSYLNFTGAGSLTFRAKSGQDIHLDTAGAGVLRTGIYTAKGAEAFDGYISQKDDGGTPRKIMTCA